MPIFTLEEFLVAVIITSLALPCNDSSANPRFHTGFCFNFLLRLNKSVFTKA